MMGPAITKKGNFDGKHKDLKNCFGIIFLFLVIVGPCWQLWVHFDNFDGPTNAKKGNFDGWYNCFKNHFKIIFPFLVVVGPLQLSKWTHNCQKRKF